MSQRSFDDLFPAPSSASREPRRSERERAHDSRPRPAHGRPHARAVGRRPTGPQRHRRAAVVIVGLVALAIAVSGGFALAQTMPVPVTLNGEPLDVGGGKTLADAMEASQSAPEPGDLLAIDGSVLEEGQGEPFLAIINGQPTVDPTTRLAAGDVIELQDGASIEEPSETVEEAVPYSFEEEGHGPIHLVEGEGADGMKRVRTGSVSGLIEEEVVLEPVNMMRRNVSPQVGDDKVIALTFDDGPWPESTAAILDVLAEHDAKATFFTVGNRIDGEGVELVKRAAAEGHQICTHSFSHAAGDGQSVNLGYMTPDDQVAEIQQGYEAIETATGKEASRVFRAPGGNYGEEVMRNAGPLVSAEIGWNVDAEDWRRPGAGPIADQIKSAWPGAIVLLHDGGGDRSQTVDALKDALPFLKAQGYRFVTMDELLSYPLS